MKKKKNPVAKALRSPNLLPRIVKPRKGKGSFKRNKGRDAISILESDSGQPTVNPEMLSC